MTSEVLNNFCFKKDKESRKQRTNNTKQKRKQKEES